MFWAFLGSSKVHSDGETAKIGQVFVEAPCQLHYATLDTSHQGALQEEVAKTAYNGNALPTETSSENRAQWT